MSGEQQQSAGEQAHATETGTPVELGPAKDPFGPQPGSNHLEGSAASHMANWEISTSVRLGWQPEHGNSPSAGPGAATEASRAVAEARSQAAAVEAISTPVQSHTIQVPPREDVLGTRAAPRRRRRMRPVVITAGLLITLGLGWTGGMNAEWLASLDLPGRALALATAAAGET